MSFIQQIISLFALESNRQARHSESVWDDLGKAIEIERRQTKGEPLPHFLQTRIQSRSDGWINTTFSGRVLIYLLSVVVVGGVLAGKQTSPLLFAL